MKTLIINPYTEITIGTEILLKSWKKSREAAKNAPQHFVVGRGCYKMNRVLIQKEDFTEGWRWQVNTISTLADGLIQCSRGKSYIYITAGMIAGTFPVKEFPKASKEAIVAAVKKAKKKERIFNKTKEPKEDTDAIDAALNLLHSFLIRTAVSSHSPEVPFQNLERLGSNREVELYFKEDTFTTDYDKLVRIKKLLENKLK